MTYDMPAWLLIVLALMWCVYVWRQPRYPHQQRAGYYVPPSVITVASFILVAGLSHG